MVQITKEPQHSKRPKRETTAPNQTNLASPDTERPGHWSSASIVPSSSGPSPWGPWRGINPESRPGDQGSVVLTSDDGPSQLMPQPALGEPFSRDGELCCLGFVEKYDRLFQLPLQYRPSINYTSDPCRVGCSGGEPAMAKEKKHPVLFVHTDLQSPSEAG